MWLFSSLATYASISLSLSWQMVALHVEGYKTYSEVERAVMTRYFLFNLANVFVTIGAGSIKDVSVADRALNICFTRM